VLPTLDTLKVKLFADGADIQGMIEMASKPYISGLTTNPTLMRKAGINDYTEFAKKVLSVISTKPISFEVFSDNLDEMKTQGEKIASWAENVYVKIPITNTLGQTTCSVVEHLNNKGIKVNVTAIMLESQVTEIMKVLNPSVPSYVSLFAGRIADTGRDPVPIVRNCVEIISQNPKSELIWASPRELLNIFQANEVGCQIITATTDVLNKLNLVGRNLEEYSLNTVKMFYEDAKKSEYTL
jgi:transaldolase